MLRFKVTTLQTEERFYYYTVEAETEEAARELFMEEGGEAAGRNEDMRVRKEQVVEVEPLEKERDEICPPRDASPGPKVS